MSKLTNKQQRGISVHTNSTSDTFTIYGCGKFGNESKVISKSEATFLYLQLHQFLTQVNKVDAPIVSPTAVSIKSK